MEAFVKAMHVLKGDGPLALTAFEQVSMLYSVISTDHYPNIYALAKSFAGELPKCICLG